VTIIYTDYELIQTVLNEDLLERTGELTEKNGNRINWIALLALAGHCAIFPKTRAPIAELLARCSSRVRETVNTSTLADAQTIQLVNHMPTLASYAVHAAAGSG
jgi:hypothetical protein